MENYTNQITEVLSVFGHSNLQSTQIEFWFANNVLAPKAGYMIMQANGVVDFNHPLVKYIRVESPSFENFMIAVETFNDSKVEGDCYLTVKDGKGVIKYA